MSATLLRTELPNGRVVRTIRLFPSDVGDFFESLVFGGGRNDFGVLDVERHRTEEEARAAHAALVLRWGISA